MSVQTVRMKVELKRKEGESTFHRFSGAYNFSELSTVVSHLWGERPKHLVLDYTDDEGDQVRIANELDWTECLRLFLRGQSPVLRLTGRKFKVPKKKKVLETSSNSDSSDSEAEVPPVPRQQGPELVSEAAAAVGAPSIPRLQIPATSSIESQSSPILAQQPTVEEDGLPATTLTPPAAEDESFIDAPMEVDPAATAVDLMSLVYNCDAGEELFKGNTAKFSNVVTREVDPENPSEVHLDIDRSKLFRDTMFKSSDLMGKKKTLPQAEHLIKTAMVVFTDNVHLQYKLACILSLQKRLEECLDMLLVAQANGFDDISKLKTDSDLSNVRTHPRFIEVVPVEGVPIDYHEEVDPNPPPVPSEPKKAAGPITTADPDVLKLVSIFPDMSLDEAVCVLVLAKGDLNRAINARVAGHYQRPNWSSSDYSANIPSTASGWKAQPAPAVTTTNTYMSKAERRALKRQMKNKKKQ